MKLRTLALGMFLILSSRVSAQTTTTLEPESISGQTSGNLNTILRDKKFEEDKRITDLELRSYAGSLNRYSLQFIMGYSGPPIDNLSDSNKPNPDGRPGDNRTVLSGTAGLRYRLTSNQAMNFGTGIKWYTPYQTVAGQPAPTPNGRKSYDVSDPQISYDITGASGPMQLRTQIKAIYTTTAAYTQAGQAGSLGFAQYVKWTPYPLSRIVFGGAIAFDYFIFDRAYVPADRMVSTFYVNLIPSLEYKLTENLNFNTSLGYPFQNLRKASSALDWEHQMSTWRVGLGWAITHDIYVNPYVNFFAEAPSWSTASLNLNTTFSIF